MNDSIIRLVAWPIAFATALWFGLMARRAGRARVLWAFWGAGFGLVLATMTLGLSVAAFGPLPGEDQDGFGLKFATAALVVVFVLGWLITRPLRQSMWRL